MGKSKAFLTESPSETPKKNSTPTRERPPTRQSIRNAQITPTPTTIKVTDNTPESRRGPGRPKKAKSSTKEEPVFEVKGILDSRKKPGGRGRVEYLIEWKGYSKEESTWEPASCLDNCQDILEKYNLDKLKNDGDKDSMKIFNYNKVGQAVAVLTGMGIAIGVSYFLTNGNTLWNYITSQMSEIINQFHSRLIG